MTKQQVLKLVHQYNEQSTDRKYNKTSLIKSAGSQRTNGWYITVSGGNGREKDQYLGETLNDAHDTIETEIAYSNEYKSYFSAL
jgi:hypothetical protein